MRQYRSRVARVAIVAAAVLGLALPAFAQAPAPQAPPAGPVRQLSMEDAISLALQNNLSLRVERINPELQDLAIAQARTVWTPNLTGSLSTASRTSPISGFFSGATDKLTSENVEVQRRREPGAAVGRELHPGLGHDPQPVQQRVRQPEPVAGLQSELQLHAAPAPEPQDRRGAQPARGQQDEPRDLGHRPAPDGADHRAQREVRVLGPQGGRRRVAGCPAVARSRQGSAQEQPVESRDRHDGARSTSSRPRPRWRAARRR